MKTNRFHQVLFALLGSFGVVALPAGEPFSADVAGKSPYETRAAGVAFRDWVSVGSSRFTLYTDADPEKASHILLELEMFRHGVEGFMGRDSANMAPVIMVLPTDRSDWRKIAGDGPQEKRQLLQPADELSNLILVESNWETDGLGPLYGAVSRAVLGGMNLRGPIWFARGMEKYLETAEFLNDQLSLGGKSRPEPQGWLPWPEFFALRPNAPQWGEASPERPRIEAQAAALAAYVLTQPDRIWMSRYFHWAALLEAGNEPTEEAFKGVFGQSFQEWQTTLEKHVTRGGGRLRSGRVAMTRAPKAHAVSPDQIREIFLIAQILRQREPASAVSLDALLDRELRAETLRDLLTEACLRLNRTEDAAESFDRLIERDSRNPAIYTKAAERLFVEHVPAISLQAKLPSEEVAAKLRTLCDRALQYGPRYAPAVDLRAWVEALNPTPGPDRIVLLQMLYGRIYGHCSTAKVVSALAIAHWRAGDMKEARELAEALLASPYADQAAKRLATDLLQELKTVAAP